MYILPYKGEIVHNRYMSKNKTKSQIGKSSKNKGKIGEREVANFLKDNGYSASRGVQYTGGPDSPDVISSLPVHIEVKRTENLSLYAAMAQAKEDCPDDVPPSVWHRRNGKEWLVVMEAQDFLDLLDSLREI